MTYKEIYVLYILKSDDLHVAIARIPKRSIHQPTVQVGAPLVTIEEIWGVKGSQIPGIFTTHGEVNPKPLRGLF